MKTTFTNNDNHLPALFSADPAAIAAAETAKARIQAAYVMALQKQRNEDEARDRILHACRRPAFAERVEFSKPVAGKQIKGPSIRFAELALREWQNILTETQVVYEDDFIRRIKVFVTDLETNRIASKEIQINKTIERKKTEGREILGERINSYGKKVFIVKATEDELNNKEAALISKAVRNEGLRLIPSDVTDEAIEVARQTLRNRDAQDPDAAKKKLLDAFSSIGVRPKDLEQYLKHKTDALTPVELEELRGIYRAIRDGEARWSDYLQTPKDSNEPETTAEDFDATIPKGIDQNQLDEFLKRCADQFNRSIDDVKAEAAENLDEFWKAFFDWQRQQKKAESQQSEGEEHKEETQYEEKVADYLINQFSKLNKEPLEEYEKAHRSKIKTWPQEAQDAFAEKWEKKMHQSYEAFLRRLDLINGKEPFPQQPEQSEEDNQPGLGIVICLENGEHVPLAYCQNARGQNKPCEMYEERSCLARWPE